MAGYVCQSVGVVEILKQDGFNIDAELYSIVEGDEPINMAKSIEKGVNIIATILFVIIVIAAVVSEWGTLVENIFSILSER